PPVDAAQPDARAAVAIDVAAAGAPAPIEHVLVFGDLLGAFDPTFGVGLSFVDEATGESREATLSTRNSYSIFGLAPGTYRIASWARGYVPLDDTLVLPSDQP